jgi:hypothetical protein
MLTVFASNAHNTAVFRHLGNGTWAGEGGCLLTASCFEGARHLNQQRP